jgi:hypothetical protein
MGAQHSLPQAESARKIQVECWSRATDSRLKNLHSEGLTTSPEYKAAVDVSGHLFDEGLGWLKREGALMMHLANADC